MMHLQHDIACCFLVLFIASLAEGNFQDYLNLEQKSLHLPEKKFGIAEYSDTDNDEIDKGLLTSQWGQIPLLYPNGPIPKSSINSELMVSDELDKNIVLDSHWAENIKFGQISAVSIDPNGNIAIFHRGSRKWDGSTFNAENKFDRSLGPIQENAIILLDKSGRKLLEWGANMFYMPHGLTIDMHGNYWITDVALHQVLKFDAKDIALMKDMAKLRRRRYNQETVDLTNHNPDNLFENYVPKPSMILGKAFEPGSDQQQFCQPTAVAVQSDGDFFVSDGYCNSRVIKFNADGQPILQWGRHWGYGGITFKQPPPPNAFYVPHDLALASELNLIFVADRENGRVVSFYATNGTFHKEYKHPSIGTRIYSVAYARGRLYLVNGPEVEGFARVHVRGFILDVNSGNILTEFWPAPRDMDRPHDMAVTEDGSEIYVVELNLQIAYRFLQGK